MKAVTVKAEYEFMDMLKTIEFERSVWRVLFFKGSLLGESEKQLDGTNIVINIFNSHLQGEHGKIFFLSDGDIALVCKAVSKKTLDNLVLELTHLYAEYIAPENMKDISRMYDLGAHWPDINMLCHQKLSAVQNSNKKNEKNEVSVTSAKVVDAIEKSVGERSFTQRKHREKPSILIVEDDPISLKMVETILKKDFVVITASDGASAYEAYLLNAPNVVFLDIGLPDCEGHEVLEKFMHVDSEAYVVMLSGNMFKDAILRAMKLGAKGFVGKPFNTKKLLQYIRMCPTFNAGECA